MKINTSRFGEIEVDTENIIEFKDGIPAFEDLKRYILISIEENESLYWLQSVDDGDIAFILADPFSFVKDYEPKLSEKVVNDLQIERQKDVLLFTMLVIPENMEDMTANLAAPVVINMERKLGRQVILTDKDYPIKYPVLSAVAGEGE